MNQGKHLVYEARNKMEEEEGRAMRARSTDNRNFYSFVQGRLELTFQSLT